MNHLSLVNFLKKENLELITNKGLIIDSYNILQINENYLMNSSKSFFKLVLIMTLVYWKLWKEEFKNLININFIKSSHRINVSKEYLKKEEIYFEKN